jgi:hypothetical protein
VTVIANTGTSTVTLPRLELLVASDGVSAGALPPDTTAWLRS